MKDQLSSDLASLKITRAARPSSSRRGSRVVMALTGVLLAGALTYFFALPLAETRLFKIDVAVTEIALVSPAQASVDLTSTGYVVPQTIARVGPKTSGRVAKAYIKEGGRVKGGELLFELDPTDQRSALASAQARVAAARARALASRAQLAEITQQWEREKKLAASGAVPQAAVDDLRARVDSLEATAKAAEAEAGAAQAEATSVGANLGNMTIFAPIGGTAINKPSEVGDIVRPDATMVELADFDSLAVETDVPEGRMHLVKPDGPCEIVLDAFPDRRFRGVVREVSPRLNRAKATGTVKVRFVGVADGVLPEMAARVSFLTKPLDDAQMKEPPKQIVPASAVTERGGRKVVFVLDEGKVHIVPILVGAPFGTGFELKEGPPPGTKVVRDPPAILSDGKDVKEVGS